ncbi:20029_t:CDS:10 [Cetraspora pellucida]|uniref:Kinetochore protein NDC80 n=1 Tax=Cetraspora pellucida TaxID=1433469 RepID=A0A9N9D727_9GLOM|nr:20029_t:CDS:10 [Cetraspora pellucida]
MEHMQYSALAQRRVTLANDPNLHNVATSCLRQPMTVARNQPQQYTRGTLSQLAPPAFASRVAKANNTGLNDSLGASRAGRTPKLNRRTSMYVGNIQPSNQQGGGGLGGQIKDIRPIRDKPFQVDSIDIIYTYAKEKLGFQGEFKDFKINTSKDYYTLFKLVYQRLDHGKDITKIDEIATALRELRYPFVNDITKSMLQAVGSVQSWPHLLGAMRWLVEYVATLESIEDQDDETEEGGFNPDSAFFKYATTAYNLFLGGDDDYSEAAYEFDAAYEQSNADIIAKSAEVQKEVEELEKQLNEMSEDPLTIAQNENKTLRSDMNKFNAYTKHLEDKIIKLKDYIVKLEEEHKGKEIELATIEEEKAEIQQKVDNQPISPDDVERMHKESEQITNNRNAIAAKAKELAKLQWEKGLDLEKRIADIEKLIQYYNTSLYRVGLLPSSAQYADGKDYELSLDVNADRIDKIISLDLRNYVRTKLSEVREKFNSEYDKIQEQITLISEEIHRLSDDNTDKEIDLNTLEDNKNILARQFEESEQSEIDTLAKRCTSFEQRISQLRSEGAAVYLEWKQKSQEIQIQYDHCIHEYNAVQEAAYNEFIQIKNDQLRKLQHIFNVLTDLRKFSENELNEVKK